MKDSTLFSKFFLLALFSFCFQMKAQYASVDAMLSQMEERVGVNKKLESINLDNKKFVLISDFNDHVERKFIILNGGSLTYVEIFDDKQTGESSSNIFTGDYVKSKHNIVSIRADLLEGQSIAIPITKTLLITRLEDILYMIDINTNERWIDQSYWNKIKVKN